VKSQNFGWTLGALTAVLIGVLVALQVI